MNIQHTDVLNFRPLYTEDGVDYVCTEFEIGVEAIVNPQALASSGAGVQARANFNAPFLEDAPAPGTPGDGVGLSLFNLRPILMQPRQSLVFSINNQNVVVVAGVDDRNGPIPQECRVVAIWGSKTAKIYFRVKTWLVEFVPGEDRASRIVLANRYTVGTSMDEDYWTTRYVSGQMIVNPRLLATQGLVTPDNFRNAAFLGFPTGFKRDNVEVTVSSDNTTLDYSYIDHETPIALGPRTLVTRFEGNCTLGSESSVKDLADAASAATLPLQIPLSINPVGWFFDITPLSVARKAYNLLPTIKANGIVRVWGQRNANKRDLMTFGIAVLQDRFSPIKGALFSGKLPRMISMYVTQDLKERFVEVRAEFMPTIGSIISATGGAFSGDFTDVPGAGMKFDTDIVSQGAAGAADPLLGDGTGLNPPPPNSGGTRGNWLGSLVAALLSAPGEVVPQTPVGNPPAVNDQGLFS